MVEIYSARSGNLHIVYTDRAGQSSIGVTPVYVEVEADRASVLPEPVIRKGGCISSEMTTATGFQMRGLETIYGSTQRTGPDRFLKISCIFVCTCRSLTDNHSLSPVLDDEDVRDSTESILLTSA